MKYDKDFIEAIKWYVSAMANEYAASDLGNVSIIRRAAEDLGRAGAHLDSFAEDPEKESKGCTESKVYIREDGNGSITSSTITG